MKIILFKNIFFYNSKMNNLQINISSDSENDLDYKNYENEILLQSDNRLTIFPIKYPEIWKMYKKQLAAHWVVEEVDLSKDKEDWGKLNNNEQTFIKNILAFFAASDTIVNINLLERFMKEIEIQEIRFVYGQQYAMENIHSEAYSLMIETYVDDVIEKDKLYNAVKRIPSIKKKKDWAFKWINSTASFCQRLYAFSIVEGVFFSGAFASIFWLKDRNLMPGLCKFNKFIARDERMHVDFAIYLYKMSSNKLDEKTVHNMMLDAIDVEKDFIIESIPCSLLGMNNTEMVKYIKYVADQLLIELGYNQLFNINVNPFDFMEKISIQTKENMFEGRVDEYQMSHISDNNKNFDLNENF